MMPVAPSLLVRPLRMDERAVIGAAINTALADTPFCTPFNQATIQEQLFAANPPSLHPVQWQHVERLAAWRARRLEGFLDAGVGLDAESLDQPDYQAYGLLRFLLLVEPSERSAEVAAALLSEAEAFWRQQGVGRVKAFHYSTGYPNFQAGLGALPGDWVPEIRALTGAGYQFTERYYCLCRPLADPIEETAPAGELSLVYGGTASDRLYQLYRRTDWVGMARVVAIPLEGALGGHRLAKLLHIEIDPNWRGRNIGKWLVKRIINDYTLQGYSQLVVHPAHHRHIAVTLFNQLGFQEENYRGYTLEKTLTE
jgi:GNAT superfamily N-acetyltransferase